MDLSNEHVLNALQAYMNEGCQVSLDIRSLTTTPANHQPPQPIKNPANHSDVVGQVSFITPDSIPAVITEAISAKATWQQVSPKQRADVLRKFADLMEEPPRMALLMMMAVREAGKTLLNAIAEVREAVDFCRYYADETERLALNSPIGTVVAISPWNFPLAIFVGEVVSALAAGNTVVAKPAEQTSAIAHLAVSWLHEAGIPTNVLQLVLGAGDVGGALTSDERIDGVIFTGSTEVAKRINSILAKRSDNPVLIAETGGMNAMIVDSTALPEQVCTDVLASAFDSAGQRCSALRILCVQNDIADHMIEMIKGAMNELVVSQPMRLNTDVGPVIDKEAQENLLNHINTLKQIAPYHEVPVVDGNNGTFVAPIMFELNDLSELKKEVFGPVLHVVRYASYELDDVIKSINKKGYALTHGIHSRIDGTIDHITSHIEAGNVYINRNIVGAVVGVQPFGGHGLSGTGPKAGGPFYLQRLSRLATWHTPKTDNAPTINKTALQSVLSVANKMGINSTELEKVASHAQSTSLHHAKSVLTGPTGETNTLSWHAPKVVTLTGGNLQQAVQALTTLAVNHTMVQVTKEHELAKYASDLSNVLTVVSQETADQNTIVVALSPLATDERVRLAGLDGAIRRVIDASSGLDMTCLYHEVSQSYNTTAAGGNASLMASA